MIYWDTSTLSLPQTMIDEFFERSVAHGAYVTSEMAAGATSTLVFTPPAPGYYLIGARIRTWEGEEAIGRGSPVLTVLLRDGQGRVIPNELEIQVKGYTWDVPVPFPVLGMWRLPAGPVNLTFQSGAPRFIFVDYFYLAPIFEAKGAPSVFLPVSPWPAEGDWIWGPPTDWVSIATTTPGSASSIELEAPVAGEYSIYVATWHDGDHEHLIDLQIGDGESAFASPLTLPAGVYWQVERLGPLSLPEGVTPFRFASDPRNPPNSPVAITALFIVPEGAVVSELPGWGREEGAFRIDGLKDDWDEVPVLLTDPEGDQSLNTDIRALKVAFDDVFMYLMLDFYSLAEHGGFWLAIDLDGNGEAEYLVEGDTESRWAIINYPDGWRRYSEGGSAVFDVIEMRVPLSLLDPFNIKEEPPEILPPDFDLDEATGFYIRYSLIQDGEPRLLDETDWVYVETPR